MVKYELGVVYKVAKSGEIDKDSVAKIFEKYSVKVNNTDEWAKRKLAYEIDGEKDGFYIFYDIDCEGDAVQEISNAFLLNQNVLKFLFLKQDKESQSEVVA